MRPFKTIKGSIYSDEVPLLACSVVRKSGYLCEQNKVYWVGYICSNTEINGME